MRNSLGGGPNITGEPEDQEGKKELPSRLFLLKNVNQNLSFARMGSIWLIGWTNRNPGYLASALFLIATRCSNHFSSLLLTQRYMHALHQAPLPISPALQMCFFPYRIYSKIYSETLHIHVALTIFQLLCPWNLQVLVWAIDIFWNPELALLF